MKVLREQLLISILALASTSMAIAANTTELKLKETRPQQAFNLDLRAGALSFNEMEDEASLVTLGVIPQFEKHFSKMFSVEAKATLNINSSRIQSRFANQAQNTIFLNLLSVNFSPLENLTLSGGSFEQVDLASPQFLQDISFPGVKLDLHNNGKEIRYGLKLQSLIPTSASNDQNRIEKEETPRLDIYGTYGEVGLAKGVKLSGNLNYYQYSDLPSVVAYESLRRGNTVYGLDVADSRFANDFSGLLYHVKGEVSYTGRLTQSLFTSVIENENADVGDNRAQLVGTSVEYRYQDISFIPSIATFYAEPDATVGFYNSPLLGHNNREGMMYSFRTVFHKTNLALQARVVEATTLNETSFQDDLQSIDLSVEVLSVKF